MKTKAGISAIVAILFLAAPQLRSQDPNMSNSWETTVAGVPSTVVVPNVSTRVVAAAANYVRVNHINLTNTTNSAVTVTVTDGSTNCNGGACNLLPSSTPLSLKAGAVYTVTLNGQPAAGGVFWSASVLNAVHGWMDGRK